MASQAFSERLVKANYDFNNPLDAARFQHTVFEFMKLVKDDSFGDPNGEELMDKFCKLVNDREVWHFAQTVVPEFRSAREEQIHEHTEGGKGYACLNHVLNKLSFLPPRRRNINVFVTEQDVVSQRQRRYVEYLEIRVRGRGAATCSELDDIEDHYSQVEAELDPSVRIRDDQSRSAEETASRARDAAKEERAVVVDGELDGMEKDGERIDETEEGTGQAKAKTT